MNQMSVSEKQLIELANDICEIISIHMDDCENPESWIHFYVKTFGIKAPVFTFNEPLKEFTKKLHKLFEFVQVSFWSAKLTNGKIYKNSDHNWYTMMSEKIFSGLCGIDENQFNDIVRPFLKINNAGHN